MLSAERGEAYRLESTFETPKALPAGYMGDGDWSRNCLLYTSVFKYLVKFK